GGPQSRLAPPRAARGNKGKGWAGRRWINPLRDTWFQRYNTGLTIAHSAATRGMLPFGSRTDIGRARHHVGSGASGAKYPYGLRALCFVLPPAPTPAARPTRIAG